MKTFIQLHEGFFGDMKALWKLTADIKKYTDNVQKKAKPPKDGGIMFFLTFWDEAIEDVEALIQKSPLSPDMKQTFYNGCVGKMYGEMYAGSGLSGGDIMKNLGWSQERYNKLSRAYTASQK